MYSREGSRSVKQDSKTSVERIKEEHGGNMSILQAGTHVLTYGSRDHDEEEEEKEDDGEENALRRRGDPCFHYTVLDQAWRSTNTTSKFKMCDRHVKWKGRSFRLHGWTIIRGKFLDFFLFIIIMLSYMHIYIYIYMQNDCTSGRPLRFQT